MVAGTPQDNAHFGQSVAISGDTVVIGAHMEDGGGLDRGAAYIFARNQGGADDWEQVKRLTASDPDDGDNFGSSVAISGDTLVVGADLKDDGGINRGAAYLFTVGGGRIAGFASGLRKCFSFSEFPLFSLIESLGAISSTNTSEIA